MIISEIIGGLGNQMFQYAAARALGHRAGVPVRLDITAFEHYTLQRYGLHNFACAADVADEIERLDVSLNGQLLEEQLLLYDTRFDHPYGKAYLRGYWQCERYFKDIRSRLLSEFQPQDPLTGLDVDIAAAMAETESIALHIRRGDYVSNPHTNAFHGVLPLEYYRAGVADILARIGSDRTRDVHYFLFSDDPDWCEGAYSFLNPKTLVRHNSSKRGFMDLHLMSRAKHHVIANSSFSWWAAWLCQNEEQNVVAPSRWFLAEHVQNHDIVPERWVKL